MLQPKRAVLRQYRQIAVITSLAFATTVCLGLLALRIAYSHRLVYIYLAWNLFLAWLPMLCALAAYNIGKRRSRLSWLAVAGCAVVWLLFFPNAPYLLTDILHLRQQPDAPLWFDLVLLLAFAWTGFFLGLVSLVLMQALVRRAAARRRWRRLPAAAASWAFALGVLGLSGFGIYLGRFLRWNSWDVFFSPLSLLSDMVQPLLHPILHAQTIAFSGLFSLFLVSAYLMIVALSHLQLEAHPAADEAP
jgi:uncharacterized membrane protein